MDSNEHSSQAQIYSRLPDKKLLSLAWQRLSLTAESREVLDIELKTRGLSLWNDPAFQLRTVVANDIFSHHWGSEEVGRVRGEFVRALGTIPTMADFKVHHGEKADVLVEKIIAGRTDWLTFWAACQGLSSPCHACGKSEDLSAFDFGLARNFKMNWDRTILGSLFGLFLGGLLGVGAIYRSHRVVDLQRMRLILCKRCVDKRKNWWGGFTMTHKHVRMHPQYERLEKAGITKFLSGAELKNMKLD